MLSNLSVWVSSICVFWTKPWHSSLLLNVFQTVRLRADSMRMVMCFLHLQIHATIALVQCVPCQISFCFTNYWMSVYLLKATSVTCSLITCPNCTHPTPKTKGSCCHDCRSQFTVPVLVHAVDVASDMLLLDCLDRGRLIPNGRTFRPNSCMRCTCRVSESMYGVWIIFYNFFAVGWECTL